MSETKTIKQLLDEQEVDQAHGLSSEEAKSRLEKYGKNKLPEPKRKSVIRIFFSQMNDPMNYILMVAIAISLGIAIYEYVTQGTASWLDSIVILIVILLNAVIGTIQEMKAENALEELKKLSAPTCKVRRDGILQEIKAEELVVGDIVILEAGDTVPADLRLLTAVNLKTDESSLTGESLPVSKSAGVVYSDVVAIGDRANMVYSSTPVTYGRGEGIVVGTGFDTEIGRIADMLSDSKGDITPLQKRLGDLSKLLGIVAIVIVALMLVIGLIQGRDWLNMLMTAISLAVAAVPEGLTAVVTITLALGVQRMVKVNSIVRKLPSVETLGSVSVICSDKTGTLTQNKMTVTDVYVNGKSNPTSDVNKEEVEEIATGMSLCSDATIDDGIFGDPTEVALVEFAASIDIHKKQLAETYPRLSELPFDSNRKMMSTVHKVDDKTVIYTKGALDRILDKATRIEENGKVRKITKADIDAINAANNEMSGRALRVLALAKSEYNGSEIVEDDFIFIGFVGMVDPPRPEVKDAVETLKGAGVRTIMITGDHRDTAFAIAKELGIATDSQETMLGTEVDKLNETELQEAVERVRVFARVSPENKVQIVNALKANGHIVAMTGDGVNDAPSLKAADIGVAMGITGTDVAKGASDMVLTDDNFASIEKAVEEGRGIYANIKKTVWFLLSSNFGEVILMLLAILLNIKVLPLVASQILFVNLVTDGLPAIALGADKKNPDVMKDKPRDPKESIFARGGIATTIGYGALIASMSFIAFLIVPFREGHYTISAINEFFTLFPNKAVLAQTLAFSVLAVSQLFHMLGMVDQRRSFIHTISKNHWLIWVAFGVGIILQLAVTEITFMNQAFSTTRLSLIEWLIVLGLSTAPIIVHEVIVFVNWIKNKRKSA